MEYQYVPTNMYGGQARGNMGTGGMPPGASVNNGQMPYGYPVGQTPYMVNNSGDNTPGMNGNSGTPSGGSGAPNIAPVGNNGSNANNLNTGTAPAMGNQAANNSSVTPGSGAASYYAIPFGGPQLNQQPYGVQAPGVANATMQSPYGNAMPPVPGPYAQGYYSSQPSNNNGSYVNNAGATQGAVPAVPQQQQQANQQGAQHEHSNQQAQMHIPHQTQPQNPASRQGQQQPMNNVPLQPQQGLGSQNQRPPAAVPGPHPPPPPSQQPVHNLHNMAPNMGQTPQARGQKPGASPNPPMFGLGGGVLSQASPTYPYPLRKYLSNLAILRAHEIINLLNVSNNKLNDMKYWVKIMSELFTPYGLFRYSRKHQDDIRQFEFTAVVIPSVMRAFGSSGVAKLEIVPHQLRAQVLNNGTIFFECLHCLLTYFFPDGSYMTNFTHFKGVFDTNLKIEWLDMFTYNFVPGVEWGSLETRLTDSAICAEIFGRLCTTNDKKKASNDSKGSTGKSSADSKRDKNNKPDGMPKDMDSAQIDAINKLRSQFKVFQNVSSFGIQEGFMRILQVNDVMSYLRNLKVYQKITGLKSPVETLASFIHQEEGMFNDNSNLKPSTSNPEFSQEGRNAHSSHPGFPNDPNVPPNSTKRRRFSSALSPLSNSDNNGYQENDASNYKKTKY